MRAEVLAFLALLALSIVAVRGNGSTMSSFDGSVTVHRAAGIALVDDKGAPLVIGGSPHGAIVVLGYTRCTDECPLTLARVSTALQRTAAARRPEAFFVTVDPQNDRPAVLRRYLAAWGNRITGVTGDPSALKRFYASLGSDDPASRYQEHDTRIFFVNPAGEVAQELSPAASVDEIARW
jgi:cytochrome oxidase Cu insertion factor (SCO1/SenC/PrrC family)